MKTFNTKYYDKDKKEYTDCRTYYNNREAWSANVMYQQGDVVSYENKIYVSKKNDNKSNTPTDTKYWEQDNSYIAEAQCLLQKQGDFSGVTLIWQTPNIVFGSTKLPCIDLENKDELNKKKHTSLVSQIDSIISGKAKKKDHTHIGYSAYEVFVIGYSGYSSETEKYRNGILVDGIEFCGKYKGVSDETKVNPKDIGLFARIFKCKRGAHFDIGIHRKEETYPAGFVLLGGAIGCDVYVKQQRITDYTEIKTDSGSYNSNDSYDYTTTFTLKDFAGNELCSVTASIDDKELKVTVE